MAMDLKELGRLLRNRRQALGIPAAVVARRAGIGRTTLWQVERGENPRTGKPSRPGKDKLERWAAALGFDRSELPGLMELAGYASATLQVGQASAYSPPTPADMPRPGVSPVPWDSLLIALADLARLPPQSQRQCIEAIISLIEDFSSTARRAPTLSERRGDEKPEEAR
jgi:transcriptional regulator with XRE-family HTH domain